MRNEASPVSAENSTNGRSVGSHASARIVRLAFEALGTRMPELASEWAESLFLTPSRYRLRERERFALSTARRIDVPFRFGTIRAWAWGAGPVVYLAHGWGG